LRSARRARSRAVAFGDLVAFLAVDEQLHRGLALIPASVAGAAIGAVVFEEFEERTVFARLLAQEQREGSLGASNS
jgi:hypothetical protein